LGKEEVSERRLGVRDLDSKRAEDMILGLDVSTSITGICLMDDGCIVKEFIAVDLRKEDSFCGKCNKVGSALDDLKVTHQINEGYTSVFIEDKLSGFSGGRTSQQTMMKLAAFNGAVTYIAEYHIGVEPIHIHPSTVKAIMKKDGLIIPKGADKKKLTLEFVKNNIENFPYSETRNGNPQAFCYDMADAYIIARAGYIKHVCNVSKS